MLLSQILKNVPHQLFGGDVQITNIQYDSRKVTKGSLFVAVRGFANDGHNFIQKAIELGAVAVLAEEKVSATVSVAVCDNTRRALSVVANNFYKTSESNLRIIGVTGTNGKTTTTYLIKQILDLHGVKTGLIGTNQIIMGEKAFEAERTTPESLDLHKLFYQMREEGVECVIMEVSSHSLELDRVYGIEFEVGVFTNLTQDHLDFHKTMENYMQSKAKLFSMCKNGAVNCDDKYAENILKLAKCPIITYGENKADLCAENIKISEKGVRFTLLCENESYEVRYCVPGNFSVYNAMSAISACKLFGIPMQEIIRSLSVARGVKGRAEVVALPAPYTVMIDYAHTPDGIENILNAVKSFAKNRIIIVFGCGGDRDKTKRPQMGEIAARLADFCVVTSDNPRTEEPESIIEDILEGMKGYEEKYIKITLRREAIAYAMNIAEPGDVILLAGKGHETYQIIGTEKTDFDERVIVKEIYQKN